MSLPSILICAMLCYILLKKEIPLIYDKIKNRIKNPRWKVLEKMFWSLFVTGAIIEFSQMGAAFIDGLVISHFLGSEAMAGEGIAYPIFSIIGVISGLIATGMQVTCSQLLGRGKVDDVNKYVTLSICVGTLLSIIATILVLCFSKPFAVILGAKGNAASLIEPASQYLFGVGVGIPPLMIVAIIAPAIHLDSGRKTVRNGAIICSISDVLFDFIAVYLNLGILGIGLATALAHYLNLAYLFLHFRKKDRMLHFVKPDVSIGDFFRMLINGSEKATKRLLNVIRPIVLNAIIIFYGGSLAMSALSMRNNLCGFTEILGAGTAAAVSLLTSLFYGEVNEEAISEVKNCEWRNIALLISLLGALIFVFAEPIAHLYVNDEGELFKMVVFAIRILGLQTPLQTLLKSRISYLQAISRPLNMNLLSLMSQLISVITSALVLGRLFGVYGILSCFLVSDALSLIIIYLFYQIKCRKLLPNKTDLLNLPAEYSLHPGDVISLDIRNMEDVASGTVQIQLFCKGHQYDSQISYYSSLAFEELAANVIQHGFPRNKANDPIIDLRVVAQKDSLVIRLRDDCPPFDITKRISIIKQNNNDPLKNLGLLVTSKVAKNITYTSAFETNNIIITYPVQMTSQH